MDGAISAFSFKAAVSGVWVTGIEERAVGNFEQATAIDGGGGEYKGEVDGDWCVWSPAGGYLIAMALRAAGRHSPFGNPLSLACHFLSAPKLGPIRLEVCSLRKARFAESVRVTLQQGDRPALEALIWCGQPVDGYAHLAASMPDVPSYEDIEPRIYPEGKTGFQSFWQNIEHRPCGPMHWERETTTTPRQRDWVRVRDFAPQRDAYMDAGRCAVVLDAFTWPAAAHAHVGDLRFVAPTISFSVDFHRRTPSPWLLSDAFSPSADAGLIGIHNRVFSPEGMLIASGNGTLTCRPRPGV